MTLHLAAESSTWGYLFGGAIYAAVEVPTLLASGEPTGVSTGLGVILVGALSVMFQALRYLEQRRTDRTLALSSQNEELIRQNGLLRQQNHDLSEIVDTSVNRKLDEMTPQPGSLKAPTEPTK